MTMTVQPVKNPKALTEGQKAEAFAGLVAMVRTLAPFAPEAFRLGADALLARVDPPAPPPRPTVFKPTEVPGARMSGLVASPGVVRL